MEDGHDQGGVLLRATKNGQLEDLGEVMCLSLSVFPFMIHSCSVILHDSPPLEAQFRLGTTPLAVRQAFLGTLMPGHGTRPAGLLP